MYYLKDTGSMWMTANTLGIHQVTVSKVVVEVCSAIATKLGLFWKPSLANAAF